MTDFAEIILALAGAEVEFIIVGGGAAAVHGSARATYDVDVVYARSPDNIARLARAFEELDEDRIESVICDEQMTKLGPSATGRFLFALSRVSTKNHVCASGSPLIYSPQFC
jgi:hypothetical protein